MSASHGHCYKCRKEVQVYGSRWCADCHYPGIDDDYARYRDLIEEGYTRYQAKLIVGWADPPEEGVMNCKPGDLAYVARDEQFPENVGRIVEVIRPAVLDGTEAPGFWCPGCGTSHTIQHGAGPDPRWGWNGDVERPAFTPSVLVRTGHHVQGYDGGGCWCDFNAELKAKGEEPCDFNCEVCHSFVTDGRIQFLGDWTHALAGQTVPLAEFPEG